MRRRAAVHAVQDTRIILSLLLVLTDVLIQGAMLRKAAALNRSGGSCGGANISYLTPEGP